MKTPITALLASCISVSLLASGCLKTRAQLREDEGVEENAAPDKPAKVEVREVQPQGQYVVDELKAEITRLNGRIEEMERAQSENKGNASQEEIKRQEARILELEQAQTAMLEAIKRMQSSAPAAEARDIFEKGKSLFKAGDYAGAIENLNSYLKNPKSKHAEEATFLRAESYFSQKQYKKAIIDYSHLTENFTKSKLMPAALFKIGLSFDKLGMKQDAKNFYADLVEKFPKSPEAKSARAKLK